MHRQRNSDRNIEKYSIDRQHSLDNIAWIEIQRKIENDRQIQIECYIERQRQGIYRERQENIRNIQIAQHGKLRQHSIASIDILAQIEKIVTQGLLRGDCYVGIVTWRLLRGDCYVRRSLYLIFAQLSSNNSMNNQTLWLGLVLVLELGLARYKTYQS